MSAIGCSGSQEAWHAGSRWNVLSLLWTAPELRSRTFWRVVPVSRNAGWGRAVGSATARIPVTGPASAAHAPGCPPEVLVGGDRVKGRGLGGRVAAKTQLMTPSHSAPWRRPQSPDSCGSDPQRQGTHNPLVPGSSPGGPTAPNARIRPHTRIFRPPWPTPFEPGDSQSPPRDTPEGRGRARSGEEVAPVPQSSPQSGSLRRFRDRAPGSRPPVRLGVTEMGAVWLGGRSGWQGTSSFS